MRRYEAGVVIFDDDREVCERSTIAGRREYINRREAMRQRQNCRCPMCNCYLCEDEARFEHQDGRGMGGGHRDDRIERDGEWFNAALCETCNSEKGSQRYCWMDGNYVPIISKQSVYETPDAGPEPWAESDEK